MNLHDYTTLAFFLLVLFCALAIHVRDDVIAAQDKRMEELVAIANEALFQRDEARQQFAYQNERVGAYLREATLLVAHNEWLKDSDMTDSDELIDGIDAWLEAQP